MMVSGVFLFFMCVDFDFLVLVFFELVCDIFFRMSICIFINLFYCQVSYNLLCEEIEGFFKLVMEIFIMCFNELVFLEVVQDIFNKVMGFIGIFDLNFG